MKTVMLTLALCLVLALAGCGSDDPADTGTADTTTSQSGASPAAEDADSGADAEELSSDPAKRPKPKIEVPDGPPPDELVVNDILVGDGPEVTDKDKISVAYVGVYYKDGKELESTWAGTSPEEFDMDGTIMIEGWKQGMKGMRVGGRRELIVPSELAFKAGDLIYVVDLLGVE